MVAGALKSAALVGLVMVIVGALSTVTLIGLEVVEAPAPSVAVTVKL